MNEHLNLHFALATQDLSLLAAGSRGQLKASGTVAGTLADPAVVAMAHGREIDYQGLKITAVDGSINFDPATPGKDSKVELSVHKLSYLTHSLDAATFTLQGPPNAYDVHLTAAAPGIAASIQANGAYSRGTFRGRLTALALSGNDALHLSLERPVDLLLAADHVQVSWLCLVGTPGSVCADGDWTAAAWSTTVTTNEIPLATLTAGMTPSVQYQGTGSALLRAFGGANIPTQGTLRAQLSDALIQHRLASKRIEGTRIGSGTINATATPALATAELSLGDGEVGTMAGKLQIQRSTARWQDMPVTGELHVHSANCSLISLYVPQIDRASGQFSADVGVAGTVGAPRLSGVVKVTDGEIDAYQVNLALRQIAMEATLNDAGIDLKTSAKAGKTPITDVRLKVVARDVADSDARRLTRQSLGNRRILIDLDVGRAGLPHRAGDFRRVDFASAERRGRDHVEGRQYDRFGACADGRGRQQGATKHAELIRRQPRHTRPFACPIQGANLPRLFVAGTGDYASVVSLATNG